MWPKIKLRAVFWRWLICDQLKAGEITLIYAIPEEVQVAKTRLEARNAKRRVRHAKKIQSTYIKPRKPFDFLYQQLIYR